MSNISLNNLLIDLIRSLKPNGLLAIQNIVRLDNYDYTDFDLSLEKEKAGNMVRSLSYMKDIISDQNGQTVHHLVLAEEVSFFNKANLMNTLNEIPNNSKVIIDCTNSKSIAYDVVELIKDYEQNAKSKNIEIEKINFNESK